MALKVVKVGADKKLLKKYINFPHDLYADDPNYVPELYMMQKDMFSRKKNPFFEHSEVESFLAIRDDQVVGRVSAINNRNYNKHHNQNIGFFGFFDTIDDIQVVTALQDAAADWCRQKGFAKMMGPTNFSINDTTGLLVDGFDEPPKLMMTYNKPYYLGLLEQYGFQKEKDLYAYILYTKKASEKSIKLAQMLEQRLAKQGITIRPITKKTVKQDISAVRDIYNDAWSDNWGFVPWTDHEMKHMAESLGLLIRPEWCHIAEHDGKPIGFSFTANDINEITKNFKKGRLLPFNVIKLLRDRFKTDYVRILTLGVKREYRRKGIEAIFFAKNILQARADNIIAGEVSWVLEDNEEMNASALKLNSELYKTYRVFSYDLTA